MSHLGLTKKTKCPENDQDYCRYQRTSLFPLQELQIKIRKRLVWSLFASDLILKGNQLVSDQFKRRTNRGPLLVDFTRETSSVPKECQDLCRQWRICLFPPQELQTKISKRLVRSLHASDLSRLPMKTRKFALWF